MKLKTLLSIGLASALTTSVAMANTIEDRVDELEIHNALNYFTFGGDLTYMYDQVDTDDPGSTKTTYNYNRLKFGLNVNAKPYNDVHFFSRLGMTKYTNTINDDYEDEKDFGRSRTYNGSDVFVEKAYFDFRILDQLVLSAGRLPTIEGNPYNYAWGKAKMGTYPKLAYSAILDGLALTYKIGDHFLNQGSFDARLVYTPFSHISHQTGSEGLQKYGTLSGGQNKGNIVTPNADMTAFMLDYQSDDLGWIGNIGGILQWIKSSYLAFNGFDTGFSPSTFSNISTASGVYFGNERVILPADFQFSLDVLTAHVDFENIGHIGLNVGVTHYTNKISEKGGIIYTPGLSAGFFTNSTYGSTTATEAKGAATLIAVSYNSPISVLNNPTFGAEYLTSDKGFSYFDFVADNLSDFYTNNGTGMHLYAIFPLKPQLRWRIGYRDQEAKYTPSKTSTLGARTEDTTPTKTKTIYTYLRLDF